jgi:hypothetical protein
LKEKVVTPVKKTEITAIGIRRADHATTFIRKKNVSTKFAEKRLSLGRHSSLAE